MEATRKAESSLTPGAYVYTLLHRHHQSVVDSFVADRRAADTYDWRHHLVCYPDMRTGKTGIYYGLEPPSTAW